MAQPITLPSLTQSLIQAGLPCPSPAFLQPILHSSTANGRSPPLAAIHATSRLRLLTSNITSTNPPILHPQTPCFPPMVGTPHKVEQILQADIPVQVLEVEDLGRSKWEQIEALESERKGETTRGRQVIRVEPTPSDGADPSSAQTQAQQSTTVQNQGQDQVPGRSAGPFKLLLQDFKGQKIYAFELKKVEKIGYPPYMSIGAKMMLKKGAKIARGVVVLEPSCVVILGGKIENLDKEWKEGREAKLRRELEHREGENG
ncbi:hypothetical protein BGZ60DRAFT_413611 [Tricladium varicosporioides]|nr:hypothetical protein BGZ60DRAFT_413611 [Hymenoscyphus varicosporioides]